MNDRERAWTEPDWECVRCAYMNLAVRTHCRNCGLSRAASPRPRARLGDPQTSHDAAHSLKTEKLSRCRQEILGLLRMGARTDEQIAEASIWHLFPQSPSSLRTRRAELVDAGLVKDSGRLGVTKSGRKTIIWEAAPVRVEAEQMVLV